MLAHAQIQASGLDRAAAQARLQKTGPNALPEKKGKPAWLRFLAHFNDVLIYVLLAAAVLTAYYEYSSGIFPRCFPEYDQLRH